MHEDIKGYCHLTADMMSRASLEEMCPECRKLETCSTGQAMKKIKEFEGHEFKGAPIETSPVGVESALEAMRAPEVE